MRILVYEWCCSGGLDGPDAGRVVPGEAALRAAEAASIAREGRAMFTALLADAARDADVELVALVDAARPLPLPRTARVCPVPAGAEVEVLCREAAAADATLIVAPETAGVLEGRVAAARMAGGRVVAPEAAFIRIAADKQATAAALAGAGVPVPAGRPLAAGEPWPTDFVRPAVRKSRDGAGGAGLIVIGPGDPLPQPAAHDTRLEAFVAGIPVGVSCLCGPAGIWTLAPLRQRFTAAPDVRYVGGDSLEGDLLRSRAEELARRSIEAVARAAGGAAVAGWVGIDMILGISTDAPDRVLEVNPRLTTSFVGHARHGGPSLVRALLDAADGRSPRGGVRGAIEEPFAFSV